MTDQELKRRYEAYTDCWRFYKKWCEPKTDDDWKNLLCEAKEIVDKDKDLELRKKLMEVTILDINRMEKEKKKERKR